MSAPVAGSRKEHAPPAPVLGSVCKAIAYYEADHMPKRGITIKEILDQYGLGDIWYEYDNSPRRVNFPGQLLRNEFNALFKQRKVAKLYSVRSGGYIKRKGFIVYVKPDLFPERQIVVGDRLPDKRRWVK